jgi:hypothetical protein
MPSLPPRIPPLAHPEDLGLEEAAIRAARAIWSTASLPEEVARCLSTLEPAGSAEGVGKGTSTLEWAITEAGDRGFFFGVSVEPRAGRIALTAVPQGEAPAGPRVDAVLREAVQRVARDEDDDRVARVQARADALLPPWTEGLDHLGELRWGILSRVALALEHAAAVGASTSILLVHEVVSLSRTRESRRRNNREDLDRFVRRLTGGAIPRLQRGVLSGPVQGPGRASLFLGKARRDLP